MPNLSSRGLRVKRYGEIPSTLYNPWQGLYSKYLHGQNRHGKMDNVCYRSIILANDFNPLHPLPSPSLTFVPNYILRRVSVRARPQRLEFTRSE